MNESLEKFYENLLDIREPWKVVAVSRNGKERIVNVSVHYEENKPLFCPVCGAECSLYDHRPRRWRHLDSCNHQTVIEADIPRVRCAAHGVKQLAVGWAEKGSRFTLEFESAVLLWLKEDPISTVAENFRLSWDEVDGIMSRAVNRGLSRRQKTTLENIGVDETSYQKRHEYVTILLDKDRDVVMDVLEDRKAATLKEWFKSQCHWDLSTLRSISMDMWDPFINAVTAHVENARTLIAFDRFHVAGHFSKALDKVRAEEHRALAAAGEKSPLTGSKYQWLKNSGRTDNRRKERREFIALSKLHLKTARAWRIKETAATLWRFSYMGVAEKHWKSLLWWISHCRLKPVIAVGKMVRSYFWGIMNAIRLGVNNSMLEAKNARIQHIKKIACGFRNRKRFKNAILFHLGGLDLSPSSTR